MTLAIYANGLMIILAKIIQSSLILVKRKRCNNTMLKCAEIKTHLKMIIDVGDCYFRMMKLYLKEFKLTVISKKILLLIRITTTRIKDKIKIKYKTKIN